MLFFYYGKNEAEESATARRAKAMTKTEMPPTSTAVLPLLNSAVSNPMIDLAI
jgi:hypothetical protein